MLALGSVCHNTSTTLFAAVSQHPNARATRAMPIPFVVVERTYVEEPGAALGAGTRGPRPTAALRAAREKAQQDLSSAMVSTMALNDGPAALRKLADAYVCSEIVLERNAESAEEMKARRRCFFLAEESLVAGWECPCGHLNFCEDSRCKAPQLPLPCAGEQARKERVAASDDLVAAILRLAEVQEAQMHQGSARVREITVDPAAPVPEQAVAMASPPRTPRGRPTLRLQGTAAVDNFMLVSADPKPPPAHPHPTAQVASSSAGEAEPTRRPPKPPPSAVSSSVSSGWERVSTPAPPSSANAGTACDRCVDGIDGDLLDWHPESEAALDAGLFSTNDGSTTIHPDDSVSMISTVVSTATRARKGGQHVDRIREAGEQLVWALINSAV